MGRLIKTDTGAVAAEASPKERTGEIVARAQSGGRLVRIGTASAPKTIRTALSTTEPEGLSLPTLSDEPKGKGKRTAEAGRIQVEGVPSARTPTAYQQNAAKQAERIRGILASGRTSDGRVVTPGMEETLREGLKKYEAQAADPNGGFLNRLGNTVKGGAKGFLSGHMDAMGAAYQSGQAGRTARDAETLAGYREEAAKAERELKELLSQDGLSAQALLAGLPQEDGLLSTKRRDYLAAAGVRDPADVLAVVNVLEDYRRKAEAMEKAVGAQEQAGEAARDLAAAVQLSGARDIERAKAGKGLAQNILVDAAASTVQMAGDAAANAILGTQGSMIPFAARALGGGTQEARAEGADLKHQMLYGGAMAAKEIFTEKMFNIALPFSKVYGGGALDDAVERAIGKAVDRFAKTEAGKKLLGGGLTFAASALSEGAEEFVGDWMEWQMPRIYGGDPEGAAETLQNSIYDFLVGAASGAVGGAVNPSTYRYEAKPLSLPTLEDAQRAPGAAQEPAQGVLQQGETQGPAQGQAQQEGPQRPKEAAPGTGTANENGLLALTEREKANLSSGKRNKIVSTFQETVSFIKNALSDRQNVDRAYLGKVPEATAQKVLNETGVDIRGYNAILPGDAVRHMFKNHGDTKAEAERGQVALTPETAANITAVLSNPDKVIFSKKTDAYGRKTLMFEKKIGDIYITAQAVTDGTKSLTTDTLYIKKGSPTTVDEMQASPGQTSETSSGLTLNETISQPDGEVNGGKIQQSGGLNDGEEAGGTVPAEAGDGGRPGRAQVFDEVPERHGSVGAGEQTGSLGGRTDRAQKATDPGAAAIKRQALGKTLRGQKVSSRSLGISRGTDAAAVTIIPESAWDEGLRNTAKKVERETGKRTTFVLDRIPVTGADGKVRRVRGVNMDSGIILQADNYGATVEQIADHEIFHDKAFQTPGLIREIEDKIALRYGREELNRIIDAYMDALGGVYDHEAMTGEELEQAYLNILEEIYADAYAGINAFGAHAEQFSPAVEETLEDRGLGRRGRETDEATDRTTGPPRFSYGGKYANRADSESLAEAERLEMQGLGAEYIRQETGWFRGMDGKWRFEIDDSGMEYHRRGDLGFRERNQEYDRYRQLTEKAENYMLGKSDTWLTDEEQTELTALQKTWSETFRKEGRISEDALPTTKLADYLKHDELFQNYPQLRKTGLVFRQLPEGTRGEYSPERDVITISEDLRHAPEDTLIHEIQHAIQKAEGFAEGSSPEYWKEQRADIAETIRAARENLDLWLNDIGYSEYVKQSVAEVVNKEKTLNQHWKDLQTFKDKSKYAKQIANCERELREYQEQYDRITNGMTPTEQYLNTAGEIEARDAAKRRRLPAEERRRTPPDLGDENTVFAEGDSGVYGDQGKAKFSMDETVEETKDLLAVHNMGEESLSWALEMGGLPMPSIAVIKADQGHSKYGPISIVFRKDTIDPQADKRNRVFGGDAWTQTNPEVEYPVNYEARRALEERIEELSQKIAGGMFSKGSAIAMLGVDDVSGMDRGELAKKLSRQDAVKAAYLADQGRTLETVMSEKPKQYDSFGNDALDLYVEKAGPQRLEQIYNALEEERRLLNQVELQEVREALKDFWRKRTTFSRPPTEERLEMRAQKLDEYRGAKFVKNAWEYIHDSRGAELEPDVSATRTEMEKMADEASVRAWIEPQLEGILGDPGIRNTRDPFTPSGRSRSFEELHDPYTLEGIVKAMTDRQDRGAGVWFVDAKSVSSVATPEYKSVPEIKADSGRLQTMDQEAYDMSLRELDQKIEDFKSDIAGNMSSVRETVGEALMEGATGKRTDAALKRVFVKYGLGLKSKQAEAAREIYQAAASLPTGYFEGKPERVVKPNEWAMAVVPDNLPPALRQKAEDSGLQLVEYKAGDDADRLRALNSDPGLRFSMDEDSQGRELTAEQTEYFKDSKVRDNQGRLRVMYHVSGAKNINVFQSGNSAGLIYFSPAEANAKKAARGKKTTYECYLNITDPVNDEGSPVDWYNAEDSLRVAKWKRAGHDGVYVRDESGVSLAVFSPEQIKSVDNTAPTNNQDIRFSADEEPGKKQDRKPVAESKPIIAKRDLRKNLLGVFSIPEGQRAELGTLVDSVADQLLREGALTEEIRNNLFNRLYSSGVVTEAADAYFQEGRNAVAGGRIFVNDIIKGDFGDDWNAFRKRAMANGVYLTNDQSDAGVDVWNQELGETLPGLFNQDELDGRAILERIVQVAEEGKDEKVSLAEYTARLAGEEYVSEREILDNMERQMDWALRTFAEKADLEIKLRDRTGVKIAQERERFAESSRRQREREALRRGKEREQQQDMIRRQRENRQLRELQQRTLKQLQWLNKNRYRAPEKLRSAWDQVLGDIDLYAVSAANEMNWSKKYEATWRDLAQMYQEAKENDPNFLPSKDLERIVKRLNGDKIADMDVGALQDLYKAAVGLRTEFYNRNQVIGDEERRLFAEVYKAAKHELKEAKGGYTGKGLDKYLNLEHLTPMNVFQRMGGWNPNGALYSMAKQLEQGERAARAYTVEAKRQLENFLEENHDWVKRADGQGKDAIWYELEVPELMELGMGDKPIFGNTIKVYMTPAQKVQLYLESKNYDNLRHMTGGRTFVNRELYSKGKRTEALAQGVTVKLAPETVKKIVSDLTDEELALAKVLEQHYNGFAAERINKVSNPLLGYDKAVSQNYAPIYTNKNFNRSEPGVFDVTAEGVPHMKGRIPYSKNPSYNISAFDVFEQHTEQTARWIGYTIPAQNMKRLLNWQDTETSMKDAITHKWGEQTVEYIENLLTELQGPQIKKKGGVDALTDSALSNYISSVFGANPGIVFKQAMSFPLAGTYLGWENVPNIAAALRTDDKLINTYTSELAYRLMGYATPETAQLKNNPSALSENKFLKFTFGGGAITAMDGWTVKSMWRWAENAVRRENPDLGTGTQEQIDAGQSPFYKEVARRFEEAVSRSQPMYDVMHRPDIMRNGNGIARAATLFKTVPLQQYNMLRQTLAEAERAKRLYKADSQPYREAQKRAGRAVQGVVLATLGIEAVNFLVAMLKNAGKRYRDDDEELTWASVGKEFLSGFMKDSAGMIAGGDVAAEFIGSKLTGDRWYGIETPGITQLQDILEELGNAGDAMKKLVQDGITLHKNGGDLKEYLRRHGADYLGALEEGLRTVAKYFGGIPADNIRGYALGALRWISPETETAYQDWIKTADKNGLKGLKGEALETRIFDILKNRTGGAEKETAKDLAVLYAAGYKVAVPPDTPESVTVDGESRKLNVFQAQLYDTVWKETVGGTLDELTASGTFREAGQETQAQMLRDLYSYAGELAKAEVFDDYPVSTGTEKAKEVLKSGLDMADYLALKETGSVDRYLKAAGKGLEAGDAAQAALAVSEIREEAKKTEKETEKKVPSLALYREALRETRDRDEQMAALSLLMSEGEYARLETGVSRGITPEMYVTARESIAEIDENNSVSQDEAARAIGSMPGLTDEERGVLWQLQNKSWKPEKNPFSVKAGERVYKDLQDGGGTLERPEEEPRGLELPRLE